MAMQAEARHEAELVALEEEPRESKETAEAEMNVSQQAQHPSLRWRFACSPRGMPSLQPIAASPAAC